MTFTANYSQRGQELSQEFRTAKAAAQFLMNGEISGELSFTSVVDSDGDILADCTRSKGYEELRALGAKGF